MSLEGAKLICLDEAGNHGKVLVAKGRKFTMGYYMDSDFVINDERALGHHCEIECDAFGRVTIRNLSPDKPISVNGSIVEIKRMLLNNSKLSILDKEYLWQFPKSSSHEFEDLPSDAVSTPEKQIGIPEQPPNSCPDFKLHRELPKRFTVHNFAYCIQSDEEGNTSTDSNEENITEDKEENQNIIIDADKDNEKESNEKDDTNSNENSNNTRNRSVTPEPPPGEKDKSLALLVTPKMNLINCTKDKENKSTQKKNKQQLTLCHQSDVVITSFSPRETGVKIEKSFTAIIKPKVLVTKPPTTPKSVYSTPKSEMNDDDDDYEDEKELINFHTPSTSKKATGTGTSTASKVLKNSSMHLVDLTTPNKLRPASPYLKSALKASTKKNLTQTTDKSSAKLPLEDQLGLSPLPSTPVINDSSNSPLETPSSVISVSSSTDTSSVVDVTSDGSNLGITPNSAGGLMTPTKPHTRTGACTPKRTPQSLMKRALLTSAKKQVATTPQRGSTATTTPRRESINRIPLRSNLALLKSPVTPITSMTDQNDSQLPRRQSMSTPTRKSMPARNRFDNSTNNFETSSPCSSTSMASRRSSLNPISAARALPTSTPVSGSSKNAGIRNRAACKTSPLHKVRKSVGGMTLPSHISKARRSIALPASTSKLTSVKEKSPQQVMSNRLVSRARKSLCVTPISARARDMVEAAKTPPACPSSILKDTQSKRKVTVQRKAVLFADKQPLEDGDANDLSRTFIVDSDEEENVEMEKDKPKDATFSPEKSVKLDKASTTINTTFSPEKEIDKKNSAADLKEKEDIIKTLEIPVDVEEIIQTKEDAESVEKVTEDNKPERTEEINEKESEENKNDNEEFNNDIVKESNAELESKEFNKENKFETVEECNTEIKEIIKEKDSEENVVLPVVEKRSDALVTEESFAEVINDTQEDMEENSETSKEEETFEINDSPKKSSQTKSQESFSEVIDITREETDEQNTQANSEERTESSKEYKDNLEESEVVETGFGEESVVEILEISNIENPQEKVADEANETVNDDIVPVKNDHLTEEVKLEENIVTETEAKSNESIDQESQMIEEKTKEDSKIDHNLNNDRKDELKENIVQQKSDEYKPIYEDITLEGSLIEKEVEERNLEGSLIEENIKNESKIHEVKEQIEDKKQPKDSEIVEQFDIVESNESLDAVGEIEYQQVEVEIVEQLKFNSEEQQINIVEEEVDEKIANNDPKDSKIVEQSELEESTKSTEQPEIDTKKKQNIQEGEDEKVLKDSETINQLKEIENDELENTSKLLEEIEDVLNKSDEIKQKYLDEIQPQDSETLLTDEFDSEKLTQDTNLSVSEENEEIATSEEMEINNVVEEQQDNSKASENIVQKENKSAIDNIDTKDFTQEYENIEQRHGDNDLNETQSKENVQADTRSQEIVSEAESKSEETVAEIDSLNQGKINSKSQEKSETESQKNIQTDPQSQDIVPEAESKSEKTVTKTEGRPQEIVAETNSLNDEKIDTNSQKSSENEIQSEENVQTDPQSQEVVSEAEPQYEETVAETEPQKIISETNSLNDEKIDADSQESEETQSQEHVSEAEPKSAETIAKTESQPQEIVAEKESQETTSETINDASSVSSIKKKIENISSLTPRRGTRRASRSAETSTTQAVETTTQEIVAEIESHETTSEIIKDIPSVSSIKNKIETLSTLTPRRSSRRTSLSAETSTTQAVEETLTPKRSTRRTSVSAEISTTQTVEATLTPRRSSRRSMSAESTNTYTPTKKVTRRASLSAGIEAPPLTPKRITSRRSSIDEEASKTVLEAKTPRAKTPRKQLEQCIVIPEEMDENMDAIIEEEEEPVVNKGSSSEEKKVDTKDVEKVLETKDKQDEALEEASKTVLEAKTPRAKTPRKQLEQCIVIPEEMDENMDAIIEEEEEPVVNKGSRSEEKKVEKENVCEEVLESEKEVAKEATVLGTKDVEKVLETKDKEDEALNTASLEEKLSGSEDNKTEQETVAEEVLESEKKEVAEEIDFIDTEVVEEVLETMDKEYQDSNKDSVKEKSSIEDRICESAKESMENIKLDEVDKAALLEEGVQGVDKINDVKESAIKNAESVEISDDECVEEIYESKDDTINDNKEFATKNAESVEILDDECVEVNESKGTATPKVKKIVKINADSPKTPVMTGMRELLKTPKAENTPRFGGIRNLLRTPKLSQENEDEEIEKLAVVADLVKTPKPDISKVLKEDLEEVSTTSTTVLIVSTPKSKKSVKIVADSPKTPIMTGMRELLKTPKAELNTPRLGGLRNLVRTPKIFPENEEEETKKLAVVAELVKTPQVKVSDEDIPTTSTKGAEISTPKTKKYVNIVADSPKTPLMTGMRELLKTPKVVNTPRFIGIRNLVQTPKLTIDNEEEEAEKLAVVAELVKTPLVKVSDENIPTTSTKDAEISTPKSKKFVKIVADSPKTPVMTGMRELLKTPKVVNTPRFIGIRNLVQTPKLTIDNEEEEAEKLAVVAELVKTPQVKVSDEDIPTTSTKDAEISTPKSKKSVKIVADSPQTPVMSGMRELLKTPKAVNTPKFIGIRNLVQTPKLTPNNEDEEIEKLAAVTELVKTPQTIFSQDVEIEAVEEIPSTSTRETHLRGVKELLKTPKSCSTPRFKGMRELMQTPKMCSTPLMGGIKELMDTPTLHKHHDLSEVEHGHLDKFLKTPTAKNIMISTLPSSAIIEKSTDSIEISTEYDLNATHEGGSANLEELFKTPVASRFVERITASYYGEEGEEHDDTVEKFNKTENQTLQEKLNKSAEEAFDKLVGQESQIDTPMRKIYPRKSLKAVKTPQAQSPFSAADVLSDLPKTDVEEWIENLDQAEPPTILEDNDDEAVVDIVNESVQEVPEDEVSSLEDEVSCLEDSLVEQDKNESITIPETCAKVYVRESLSNVTTSSEVMLNLTTIEKTSSKDPLANTTMKVKTKSRPVTPIDAEISGIDLLDQTLESVQDEPSMLEEPLIVEEPSMFEEHLVVSDDESETDTTVNNLKDITEEQDSLANKTLDADEEEDANDLSEPLLVSDSEDLNQSQDLNEPVEENDLQNKNDTATEDPLESSQKEVEENVSEENAQLKVGEKSMLAEEPSEEVCSTKDPLEDNENVKEDKTNMQSDEIQESSETKEIEVITENPSKDETSEEVSENIGLAEEEESIAEIISEDIETSEEVSENINLADDNESITDIPEQEILENIAESDEKFSEEILEPEEILTQDISESQDKTELVEESNKSQETDQETTKVSAVNSDSKETSEEINDTEQKESDTSRLDVMEEEKSMIDKDSKDEEKTETVVEKGSKVSKKSVLEDKASIEEERTKESEDKEASVIEENPSNVSKEEMGLIEIDAAEDSEVNEKLINDEELESKYVENLPLEDSIIEEMSSTTKSEATKASTTISETVKNTEDITKELSPSEQENYKHTENTSDSEAHIITEKEHVSKDKTTSEKYAEKEKTSENVIQKQVLDENINESEIVEKSIKETRKESDQECEDIFQDISVAEAAGLEDVETSSNEAATTSEKVVEKVKTSENIIQKQVSDENIKESEIVEVSIKESRKESDTECEDIFLDTSVAEDAEVQDVETTSNEATSRKVIEKEKDSENVIQKQESEENTKESEIVEASIKENIKESDIFLDTTAAEEAEVEDLETTSNEAGSAVESITESTKETKKEFVHECEDIFMDSSVAESAKVDDSFADEATNDEKDVENESAMVEVTTKEKASNDIKIESVEDIEENSKTIDEEVVETDIITVSEEDSTIENSKKQDDSKINDEKSEKIKEDIVEITDNVENITDVETTKQIAVEEINTAIETDETECLVFEDSVGQSSEIKETSETQEKEVISENPSIEETSEEVSENIILDEVEESITEITSENLIEPEGVSENVLLDEKITSENMIEPEEKLQENIVESDEKVSEEVLETAEKLSEDISESEEKPESVLDAQELIKDTNLEPTIISRVIESDEINDTDESENVLEGLKKDSISFESKSKEPESEEIRPDERNTSEIPKELESSITETKVLTETSVDEAEPVPQESKSKSESSKTETTSTAEDKESENTIVIEEPSSVAILQETASKISDEEPETQIEKSSSVSISQEIVSIDKLTERHQQENTEKVESLSAKGKSSETVPTISTEVDIKVNKEPTEDETTKTSLKKPRDKDDVIETYDFEVKINDTESKIETETQSKTIELQTDNPPAKRGRKGSQSSECSNADSELPTTRRVRRNTQTKEKSVEDVLEYANKRGRRKHTVSESSQGSVHEDDTNATTRKGRKGKTQMDPVEEAVLENMEEIGQSTDITGLNQELVEKDDKARVEETLVEKKQVNEELPTISIAYSNEKQEQVKTSDTHEEKSLEHKQELNQKLVEKEDNVSDADEAQPLEVVAKETIAEKENTEKATKETIKPSRRKRTASESSQGSVNDDDNISTTRRGRRKVQKTPVEEPLVEEKTEIKDLPSCSEVTTFEKDLVKSTESPKEPFVEQTEEEVKETLTEAKDHEFPEEQVISEGTIVEQKHNDKVVEELPAVSTQEKEQVKSTECNEVETQNVAIKASLTEKVVEPIAEVPKKDETLAETMEEAKEHATKRGRRKPTVSESSQDSTHDDNTHKRRGRRKVQKAPVEDTLVEEKPVNEELYTISTAHPNEKEEQVKTNDTSEENLLDHKPDNDETSAESDKVINIPAENPEVSESKDEAKEQAVKRGGRRKATVSESSQGSLHDDDDNNTHTRKDRRKVQKTPIEEALVEENSENEEVPSIPTADVEPIEPKEPEPTEETSTKGESSVDLSKETPAVEEVKEQTIKRGRRKPTASESSQVSEHGEITSRKGRRKIPENENLPTATVALPEEVLATESSEEKYTESSKVNDVVPSIEEVLETTSQVVPEKEQQIEEVEETIADNVVSEVASTEKEQTDEDVAVSDDKREGRRKATETESSKVNAVEPPTGDVKEKEHKVDEVVGVSGEQQEDVTSSLTHTTKRGGRRKATVSESSDTDVPKSRNRSRNRKTPTEPATTSTVTELPTVVEEPKVDVIVTETPESKTAAAKEDEIAISDDNTTKYTESPTSLELQKPEEVHTQKDFKEEQKPTKKRVKRTRTASESSQGSVADEEPTKRRARHRNQMVEIEEEVIVKETETVEAEPIDVAEAEKEQTSTSITEETTNKMDHDEVVQQQSVFVDKVKNPKTEEVTKLKEPNTEVKVANLKEPKTEEDDNLKEPKTEDKVPEKPQKSSRRREVTTQKDPVAQQEEHPTKSRRVRGKKADDKEEQKHVEEVIDEPKNIELSDVHITEVNLKADDHHTSPEEKGVRGRRFRKHVVAEDDDVDHIAQQEEQPTKSRRVRGKKVDDKEEQKHVEEVIDEPKNNELSEVHITEVNLQADDHHTSPEEKGVRGRRGRKHVVAEDDDEDHIVQQEEQPTKSRRVRGKKADDKEEQKLVEVIDEPKNNELSEVHITEVNLQENDHHTSPEEKGVRGRRGRKHVVADDDDEDHIVQQEEQPTKSRRVRGKKAHDKEEQKLVEEVIDEPKNNELSEVHITEVNLQEDDHHTSPEEKGVRGRRGRKHVVAEDDDEHHDTKTATKRRAATKPVAEDHEESGPVSKRRVGRRKLEHAEHEAEVPQEETSHTESGTTSSKRRAGRRKQDHEQEEHTEETKVTAEEGKYHEEKSVETDAPEDAKKGRGRRKKDEQPELPSTSHSPERKPRGRKRKESQTDNEDHHEHHEQKSRKRNESHTDNEDHHHSDHTKIPETEVAKLTAEIAPQTPQRSATRRSLLQQQATTIDVDKHDHVVAEETEDSPSKRNMPIRKAATAYHNYDETSDSDKPTKGKKKIDSPRKSLEAKPTPSATVAITVTDGTPSSSTTVQTTTRGRTRKPTARVQQFLEEERAKAETPKKRALLAAATAATNTPTPQRMPGRRGRKASTIETAEVESVGTPVASKRGRGRAAAHTEEDHKETANVIEEKEIDPTTPLATSAAKGRRGGRKAKTSAEDHHNQDEPPAKKSPLVLEAEKQETSPVVDNATPTRTAGRRNAAAAASARIEEDALLAAATDPPKRGRAKKALSVKAVTAIIAATDTEGHSSDMEEEQNKKSVKGTKTKNSSPQKRDHELASASTIDGADKSNTDDENEGDIIEKAVNKRGTRKIAASTSTTDSPAVPAKRGRKAKTANETESVVEPIKTTRGAGRGRKNVHVDEIQAAEISTQQKSEEDPSTAEQTADETSAPAKRGTRTRRK